MKETRRGTGRRTLQEVVIVFYLSGSSNRCSACQLGTDTLIRWSGCVRDMQIHSHLNMCFSSSNHGAHPLTLQPAHLLAQSIFIYTHTVYMHPQIFSIPLFLFCTCKCTTILKLFHRVVGIWWEQEERLLILFNFPRVHCLGRTQKHTTACLLHFKSAYVDCCVFCLCFYMHFSVFLKR